MDAFSVSVANGLNEPNMSKTKVLTIAFTFGEFQFAMPMLGWFFVDILLNKFSSFQKFIPWISLILLSYIGIKMIIDGTKNIKEEEKPTVGVWSLFVQSIATSIDALSVGFTIAEYDFIPALVESIIIGIMTTIICIFGVKVGKKFGNKYSKQASIIGGIILIVIGIEIFIKGII